jgi:2-amino-4-hydroxy-6-hydroxymethyldihydropteridine diphosphokinase
VNVPIDPPQRRVAIGLGCSLGDRVATLNHAIRAIGRYPDTELIRASSWYRTPPLRGGSAKGWFLNAVVLYRTSASAYLLLARCRTLEAQAGRRRASYWGDRSLDLDLLLIEDERHETEELQVPHPAWRHRPFVVAPLREVWPDAVDPVSGQTVRETPDPAGPRAVRVGVVAKDVGSVTPPDRPVPARRTP